MVFSSLIFLYAFLPIVLLGNFLIRSIKYKNIFLMIASLIFYSWGEPVWVILLIITGVMDYTISHLIEDSRITKKRFRANKTKGKILLLISISVNLSFLIVFKYSGFFVENINLLLHTHIPVPRFNLPIGISFYSFQTMSYTIDVYRGDVKAEDSFLDFLMYVSFFTMLVAGPIIRYIDIAKQIKSRLSTMDYVLKGINRFLIGLFKKVIIANYAGVLVNNSISGSLSDLSVFGMWLGIFFYAIQIYFDFSGYSDMAIGLGKMFGFDFLENFNYPYISKSLTEFWRRWHMSLSTFFRDYVYIPLGGNRRYLIRNLFIVWFLTGLWHGANWNFILWGLYFFIMLLMEKLFLLKLLKKLPSFFQHFYMIFFLLLSFVIFYFENITASLKAFSIMFGFTNNGFISNKDMIFLSNNYVFIIISVVACLPVVKFLKKFIDYFLVNNSKFDFLTTFSSTAFNFVTLLWCSASLVGSTYNPFIYFKF
ncbi:MAG: MBOAT family protein [Oscillospiraceae bacterium]|nr:MBOAT family protein [Oscillospiraceae bacterium]